MLADMEKVDARKLPREAQEEMRRQAMRMREKLQLTWKEVARVVGVSIGTVLRWSNRYAMEGVRGSGFEVRATRAQVLIRPDTEPSAGMAIAFHHCRRKPEADEFALCLVEPACGNGVDKKTFRYRDAHPDSGRILVALGLYPSEAGRLHLFVIPF